MSVTDADKQQAGVNVALLTVTLDAIGIGIIFPVMPDLLLSMGVHSVSEAALWGGVLATLYALMQFLFSPLLGALSDRFGRRPVMLCSLATMAAAEAELNGLQASSRTLEASLRQAQAESNDVQRLLAAKEGGGSFAESYCCVADRAASKIRMGD